MAKREIPLFIIDALRTHKRGECDFLVCTDRDNGFIAKIDFIPGDKEETGADYRIGYANNGISCRIRIQQMTGVNSRESDIRTLLKKGLDYYVQSVRCQVNIERPSRQQCADFIRQLIRGNMKALDDAGSDYARRNIVKKSLSMLEASADYLTNN